MKMMKFIFLCVFVLGTAFFFLRLVEKDNEIGEKNLVHSESALSDHGHTYYMKMKNDNIIVYNKDHTVYEYTDLEPEFLPEDVKKNLVSGITFQNQEDLYEFLETYSS